MNALVSDSTKLLEDLIAKGDLSKLSPEQRIAYYKMKCQLVGLDPSSQPFEYMTLKGKMVLYATKAATDQLRMLHKISLKITHKESLGDVFTVCVTAIDPNGRTDEDMGALPIGNLTGDALSNALMKCITKAKRRVTLSICGLGMLDEMEVDTIPQVKKETEHTIIAATTAAAENRKHEMMELLNLSMQEYGYTGDMLKSVSRDWFKKESAHDLDETEINGLIQYMKQHHTK